MTKENWRNSEWRINAYMCTTCKFSYLTVDVDEGVTPFIHDCKNPNCNGAAQSAFYPEGRPVPDHFISIDWEWYAPKKKGRKYRNNKSHIDQGGLLLRRRTEATPINRTKPNKR